MKGRENLVEVVASAIARVDSYTHERRVRFEPESKTDPIPLRINQVDIKEMLVNVLRNAIESGPKNVVRILLDADEDCAGSGTRASIQLPLDLGPDAPTDPKKEETDSGSSS